MIALIICFWVAIVLYSMLIRCDGWKSSEDEI